MQGDLILKKLVELSALKGRDSRTRRLFILADGKRSLEQLFELCGFDLAQGELIAETLVKEGFLGMAADTPADQGEQIVVTRDIIEQLTNSIAHYIGPIASILVEKNISEGNAVSRPQLDKIMVKLAEHIDGHDEKRKFLMNMKAAF